MELVPLNSKEIVKLAHYFTEYFQQRIWRLGFHEQPNTPLEGAGSATVKRVFWPLVEVEKSHKVLCLGACGIHMGYFLSNRFACWVTAFCDGEGIEEASFRKMTQGGRPKKMMMKRSSLTSLPHQSGSFDAVISHETLGFFDDKERVLRPIACVFKPKSRWLLTFLFLYQNTVGAATHSTPNMLLIPPSRTRQSIQLIANSYLAQVLNMDMMAHLAQHYKSLSQFVDNEKGRADKILIKQLLGKFNNWLQTCYSTGLGWGMFLFQKSNV